MKRILYSLATIAMVGALVAGATGAFYSDIETSANNILTAGSIDLTVDHLFAIYNGFECEEGECDPWANEVEEATQGLRKDGTAVLLGRSDPSVALGPAQTSGAAFDSTVPAGSFYSLGFGGTITLFFEDSIENGAGDDVRIYEVTGGTSYPEEKVRVEVSFDGSLWQDAVPAEVLRDGTVDLGTLASAHYVRLTDMSDPSIHTADADGYDLDAIEAIHCGSAGAGSFNDPADNICELWDATDLTDEKFFILEDVKPGDDGQNHISLHVEDNDAWGCLFFGNGIENENDLVEAEADAGDVTPSVGELGQHTQVMGWRDDGDHVFEPGDGEVLTEIVSLSLVSTAHISLPIADSTYASTTPLAGGATSFFDIFWCVGAIGVDGATLSCDGNAAGSEAQTDSLEADVTIYAEQYRDNPGFVCADTELLPMIE